MLKTDVPMNRNWEECPRGPGRSRWNTLYATLNPAGELVISRFTHEAMGSPRAYVLLFERESNTIGMRAISNMPELNAYPAYERGRHGGRRISAYRLCREIGLSLSETIRFHQCYLDHHGILILDLKRVVPARHVAKGVFRY